MRSSMISSYCLLHYGMNFSAVLSALCANSILASLALIGVMGVLGLSWSSVQLNWRSSESIEHMGHSIVDVYQNLFYFFRIPHRRFIAVPLTTIALLAIQPVRNYSGIAGKRTPESYSSLHWCPAMTTSLAGKPHFSRIHKRVPPPWRFWLHGDKSPWMGRKAREQLVKYQLPDQFCIASPFNNGHGQYGWCRCYRTDWQISTAAY